MPTKSYPVHQPVKEAVPNLRDSLENVYVVAHTKGQLFHLKDLTFVSGLFDEECDAGWVMKRNADGGFDNFELDKAVKAQLTDDPDVIACLDKVVIDYCTGKIYYDVAWWACDFNEFMEGFCNRYFEV